MCRARKPCGGPAIVKLPCQDAELLDTLFIGCTLNRMKIEFDSTKRDKTLAERDVDFARAGTPHYQHEESQ